MAPDKSNDMYNKPKGRMMTTFIVLPKSSPESVPTNDPNSTVACEIVAHARDGCVGVIQYQALIKTARKELFQKMKDLDYVEITVTSEGAKLWKSKIKPLYDWLNANRDAFEQAEWDLSSQATELREFGEELSADQQELGEAIAEVVDFDYWIGLSTLEQKLSDLLKVCYQLSPAP